MQQASELYLNSPHGKIAALCYGPEDAKPILALHGWLDNAASFMPLLPYLQEFRVIAIDLPGHGFSYHKPKNSYFHFVDYIPEILALIKAENIERPALLGHSLGAGISSILASILETQEISSLALIDGLGPLSIAEDKVVALLNKAARAYVDFEFHNKKLSVHPSIDSAIAARLQVNLMHKDSAKLIVLRNLQQVDGGYSWRTDPRLLLQPLMMLTEQQVLHFMQRIETPTCIIKPQDGWPFDQAVFDQRLAQISNPKVYEVPGNHHVHMDSPEIVGPILADFFRQH